MAEIDKIYGHSIVFGENLRIKFVDTQDNIITGVKITLLNDGNTYMGVTNNLGYVDFYIESPVDDYSISYKPANPIQFNSGTNDFSVDVTELEGIYIHEVVLVKNTYLDPNPSNKFNFIRWHSSSNFHLQGGILGSKDINQDFTALNKSVDSYVACALSTDVPNNYARNVSSDYQPPFFAEDNVSFILNFFPDFGGFTTEDLTIAIVNKVGEVVVDDIGLSSVYCNGTYIYSFELEFPEIGYGTNYRFAIYNTENNVVYYLSNPFRVEDCKYKYPVLRYRNSCASFGYQYSCLPSSFTQLRVDFNLIEQQPEIELKQYREQSTGYLRNQKTQSAKVLKLESYMFDNGSSDAMLALSTHDDITLNGNIVEVKTAYKIAYNKLNKKWKGEIDFYDQDYSTVNLHGNQPPANITQPPIEGSGEAILDELGNPILDELGNEILEEFI